MTKQYTIFYLDGKLEKIEVDNPNKIKDQDLIDFWSSDPNADQDYIFDKINNAWVLTVMLLWRNI